MRRRADVLQRPQLHLERVPASPDVPDERPVVRGRPDLLRRAHLHHGHVSDATPLRGGRRRLRSWSDVLRKPELPDRRLPVMLCHGWRVHEQQPMLRDRLLRPGDEQVCRLPGPGQQLQQQLPVLQQRHLLHEHVPELRRLATSVRRGSDVLRRPAMHRRQLLHRAGQHVHGRPFVLLRLVVSGGHVPAMRERRRGVRGCGARAMLLREQLQRGRDMPGKLTSRSSEARSRPARARAKAIRRRRIEGGGP
jgi:hypothetical protein